MLRRLISASCATTLLLLGAPSTRAAPPPPVNEGASETTGESENDASERVDRAIEAWRNGEWTEVRDLLEPLVRDGDDGIEDALLRESALRYLAEATLLDEGLDPDERKELARGYIVRLLESSPDWAPPSGLHGRAFYDLVGQIRSERDAALAEACHGKLTACSADLAELRDDYERVETELELQPVAVTEVTKRNRGLALLPLGIGHFTNDNFALGGTFLALEIATGAIAIGLLIYRARGLGCVRTNGFAPKSLVCSFEEDEERVPELQDHVENVRNAEAVMGYLFLGSILVDIALAQALFKPVTVEDKGIKTRQELEAESESDDPRRRKLRKPKAKLEIRPHPAYFQRGVGFGVTLRF
jgi:hypothetical protein